MLYSAETWTLGRHQTNKLLATEVDFWWRAAKNSRKEKTRNIKIREIVSNSKLLGNRRKMTEVIWKFEEDSRFFLGGGLGFNGVVIAARRTATF